MLGLGTTGIKCLLFIHFSGQLAQKRSGTSLTLGMCSGVQWWGGGGAGHYRLLRAHAGPRGRWRQTGQPPHKASNQSAPIHCRWHQDPAGRMGMGGQGQTTLGVRSAQSRLPVDRIWCNISPPVSLLKEIKLNQAHSAIIPTNEAAKRTCEQQPTRKQMLEKIFSDKSTWKQDCRNLKKRKKNELLHWQKHSDRFFELPFPVIICGMCL